MAKGFISGGRQLRCLLLLLVGSWLAACQQSSEQLLATANAKSGTDSSSASGKASASGFVQVQMRTSKGDVTLRLNQAKAPISTANMLAYIEAGYYENTVFHRIIPGFMAQGGGFTADLQTKPNSKGPIRNEANNGLRNKRGTIAMARTSVVDSATSQFFINLADNDALDHQGERQFGYAVFGEVVAGMEVVDSMAKVARKCPSTTAEPCTDPTLQSKGLRDVPQEPIVIQKMVVLPAN